MKGKNHIISLTLCIMTLFTILLPVVSSSARESIAEKDTYGISPEHNEFYEEANNEKNDRSEEDATEFSMFKLNTETPVVFTQNEHSFTVYPAEMNADVNGDGKCNASDARSILRVSARLDKYSCDKAVLDVDCDGDITAADARFVLRYSSKTDRYFLGKGNEKINGFAKNSNNQIFYFKNGIITTGLTEIDKNLYFFDENDGMKTGLVSVCGKLYGFADDGKALNGKNILNSAVYFFENGAAKTGLIKDGDYFYFIDEDYKAAVGKRKINGTYYNFANDGRGKPGKDPATLKIAMLGDSLVANIGSQNVTNRIDFYGKVSLHANTVFSKKISGSSRFIIDEINGRGYDAVIVLVGINDLSNSDTSWAEQYRSVLKGIKDRAPDATVYAHAILPINEEKAKKAGYSCTNAQISGKNNVIKNVAKQEDAIFINPAEVLADSTGKLPFDAASDGIHINKTYCKKWSDWLINSVCK